MLITLEDSYKKQSCPFQGYYLVASLDGPIENKTYFSSPWSGYEVLRIQVKCFRTKLNLFGLLNKTTAYINFHGGIEINNIEARLFILTSKKTNVNNILVR